VVEENVGYIERQREFWVIRAREGEEEEEI
jgi:hypothetical protein